MNCGSFQCSVNVFVSANNTKVTISEKWFLYVDTGYYYEHDGNFVYYYEEFCSFYKCMDDSACLTQAKQIVDDSGTTVFSNVSLSASLMKDAVVFGMASGADGNVYQGVMDKMDVHVARGGGMATIRGAEIEDVLIDVSVMGRAYQLDAVLV